MCSFFFQVARVMCVTNPKILKKDKSLFNYLYITTCWFVITLCFVITFSLTQSVMIYTKPQ